MAFKMMGRGRGEGIHCYRPHLLILLKQVASVKEQVDGMEGNDL